MPSALPLRKGVHMKQFSAQLLDDYKHELAESPFYDPRFRRYSWVDITKGEFWTKQDGTKTCFTLGQPIGAAVPLADEGGYLLAAMDGLYVYKNGQAELLQPLNSVFKSYWRCNDAKADPAGRLFFGASVADAHTPEGALFSYDKGKIKLQQENTKIANGMAWSSDRKHFYFADSIDRAVYVYDYDYETGDIAGRRILRRVENDVPDGMCIDADDNLWIAVWGGYRIEKRNGSTGELLAEISVPAKNVTSCCFAEDANTLFITTSGIDLNGEGDGRLYTCKVDASGAGIDYAVK